MRENETKNEQTALLISVALSTALTIALLYSTLELPHVLNRVLMQYYPDYGYHWHEAEQFINSIRPFGYICFVAP